MALIEYKFGQAFPGVIGRTFDVSKPAWPAPNRAKPGSPNVLFIVLDDTGFDGAPVGSVDLPVAIPLTIGLAGGICVGRDAGSPVMTDYKTPFAFTGTVKKALVDITGEAVEDKAAQMKVYLARQ
jgi:hypothetical protein